VPSSNGYLARLTSQEKTQSNFFPFELKQPFLILIHHRITSYINNLHPTKEKHLYGLIEKLIDASIPLWNATLAPLADEKFGLERRIEYTKVTYDPASFPDSEMLPREPGEDDDSYWARTDAWVQSGRRLVLPEPNEYFQPLPEPVFLDLKSKYGSRGLQVIVKLANIQLTPDEPEYEGGTWHVEGQMVCIFLQRTALYLTGRL